MQTETYDILFAGGGLSGLTLALELARRPAFRDKKMLLLDRDQKQQNDRTWCFWAADSEPLPPVVYKTWNHCRFLSPGFEKRMDIAPFRYRLVRGIDFYEWAKNELAKYPNITRIQANIHAVDAQNGVIQTDKGKFAGTWIFNSAFTKIPVVPQPNALYPNPPFSCAEDAVRNGTPIGDRRYRAVHLLQHFKGWLIKTPNPVFDPEVMTFMDFRIGQHGETRFVYVLPFSPTQALVEFTVFSPALLPEATYRSELQHYLRHFPGIEAYQILEEEFGVIPMTDFPFPGRAEGKVIHIGTAGGFVKASSGFAFKRTHRKIRAFADAWERNGYPDPAVLRSSRLFRAFDSIFLRVLNNRPDLGCVIFTRLFQRLPPALVLRFLDEDTTFAENVRLVSVPPTMPFLRALWQQFPYLHQI